MGFPLHETNKTDVLKIADRCDRCNARAFVMAVIRLGDSRHSGSLLFCGHHYYLNESAIKAASIRIADERYKLTEV